MSTWNVTDNVHPGPSGSEASAVWGAISVEWKHHLKVEKRDVDKVTILLPDAPHFDLQYFIDVLTELHLRGQEQGLPKARKVTVKT